MLNTLGSLVSWCWQLGNTFWRCRLPCHHQSWPRSHQMGSVHHANGDSDYWHIEFEMVHDIVMVVVWATCTPHSGPPLIWLSLTDRQGRHLEKSDLLSNFLQHETERRYLSNQVVTNKLLSRGSHPSLAGYWHLPYLRPSLHFVSYYDYSFVIHVINLLTTLSLDQGMFKSGQGLTFWNCYLEATLQILENHLSFKWSTHFHLILELTGFWTTT